MIWGHAIGIYLLAGTVLAGLGLIARARWKALGTLRKTPQGKHSKKIFVIGITLGALFWPLSIFITPFMWWLRGKVKGVEKCIEFCEHSTQFEPICGPCSRELQRTSASATTKIRVGGDAVEIAARRHLAEIAAKVNAELGQARSYFRCAICMVEFEGFPSAANAEGMPLCKPCSQNTASL